jgi:hypothetical protein
LRVRECICDAALVGLADGQEQPPFVGKPVEDGPARLPQFLLQPLNCTAMITPLCEGKARACDNKVTAALSLLIGDAGHGPS